MRRYTPLSKKIKKKIKTRNNYLIDNDLKDPTGWTLKNNPHPWNECGDDPTYRADDEYDYRNYHEWKPNGNGVLGCHQCILRAKYGSGNCIDGGPYFKCFHELGRPIQPVKTLKQSTLDLWG